MSLREAIVGEMRVRDRRAEFLSVDLLGEPGWDILLALALDRIDGRKSSITGVSYAAGVPLVTGLRHIGRLIETGHATRRPDPNDGRRSWLTITDVGFGAVAACFEQPALWAVA